MEKNNILIIMVNKMHKKMKIINKSALKMK